MKAEKVDSKILLVGLETYHWELFQEVVKKLAGTIGHSHVRTVQQFILCNIHTQYTAFN